MEDKFKLYQLISSKLGWDDMLSHIAIPAVNQIITNHISHICDCTGDIIDFEAAASSLLEDDWTSDDIFSLLVSPDYIEWDLNRDLFCSLRNEIEHYMKAGYSYKDAINEWYK